jgi:hypothetical protein
MTDAPLANDKEDRMPTSVPSFNKYRAAIEVLQRGREMIVDTLADEVLDQCDDMMESGYAFNEFLEGQGTRLHFLSLLVSQLEQSAEALDEARAAAMAPAPRKRTRTTKPRAKKVTEQTSREKKTGEA